MFPSMILEVYNMKNKKSGKRSENISVKKKKKNKIKKKKKNCFSRDSIPGLLRGSPRSIPQDHLGYVTIQWIFSTYIIQHRVLRSRVTVYLPPSLSCANY